MIIYPALDVKEGRCVRLLQGNFEKETIYSENPMEVAMKWESLGAQYLHVVDLDGARTGVPMNIPTISELAVKLAIPVQLGGGIRTIDMIEVLLCRGIERVILGTTAVKDRELVKRVVETFEGNVVIGIDAKEGNVAIEGWTVTSDLSAVEFAKRMQDIGASTIIYTDISKDGMLTGPNLKAMEEMVSAVDIDIIASGGVGKLEDIKALKETGVAGAIVGKALYTGDIDLVQAIEMARGN